LIVIGAIEGRSSAGAAIDDRLIAVNVACV
jgi:hypothetical protein